MKTLWQTIRATYDPHDAWGSTQGWHFAIAEVLYRSGEDVPARWQFQPSPLHKVGQPPHAEDTEAWDIWDLLHDGEITADDLRAAGDLLARHAARITAAGQNY